MKYKEEIRREDKGFYVSVTGIVDGSQWDMDDYEATHAETVDGHYVGDVGFADGLAERGIRAKLISPEHSICAIGFSEKLKSTGKWFGWSHRAIFGFQIGAEVKRGDCAYVPTDMEDARLDAVRFWSDERRLNTTAELSKDEEGKPCFDVAWLNTDDPELIPNEKRRGKIFGVRHYPPEQFGKGEWTATTLEDAKQMAVDFAEGVS